MKYLAPYSMSTRRQNAVLIAVSTNQQPIVRTNECLDELEFLAQTMGITTVKRFTQRLPQGDRRTYIGKGKLDEIRQYLQSEPVDVVICDDDLVPAQFRFLETHFAPVRVMDRALLVLEIFESRAQSQQSKLALELARCRYFYPRLTRLRSNLDRQHGGNTGMRGPGETALETDRQLLKDRIATLKEKLRKVDLQALIRRQERERTVRVALVGYTNVGKSSLMNVLSKASVHAEDQLFATVDTLVRRVEHWAAPFLLTDTVGFIRKLSSLLIESFKSTLDEVKEADVLLLVEDISSPFWPEHLQIVHSTLREIGVYQIPIILVLNKVDRLCELENGNNAPACDIQIKFPAGFLPRAMVYVSAAKKLNIGLLQSVLEPVIQQQMQKYYPSNRSNSLR